MNNVNLIGYLGKDFEVGTTNSGRVYAKILLQLQSDGKMKEAMKKVARLGYLLFYLAKVQKVHQHTLKKVLSLRVVENYHPINIKMKMEILEQC
ncbi:hypothetical protein B10525_17730 (plasmid) [Campylobacter jejuni]|nr:hypothetical protein B10525_17730 [Campylobacter jejuni]